MEESTMGRTLRLAACVFACIVVVSTPGRLLVAAGSGRSRSSIKNKLAEPVSLDFAQTPVRDVIIYLRDISGINFVLDAGSEADSPTTIKLSNTPMATALSLILKQAGLASLVEEHAVYVATPSRLRSAKRQKKLRPKDKALKEALKKPTALDFASTPLQHVATFLSDTTGVNIVVDGRGEEPTATMKVSDMPLGDCLVYLARLTGTRLKCRGNAVVFSKGKLSASRSATSSEPKKTSGRIFLYALPNGKSYHRKTCPHFVQGKKKVGDITIFFSLAEAKQCGMKQCETCKPPR